jgi:hypothetical protein
MRIICSYVFVLEVSAICRRGGNSEFSFLIDSFLSEYLYQYSTSTLTSCTSKHLVLNAAALNRRRGTWKYQLFSICIYVGYSVKYEQEYSIITHQCQYSVHTKRSPSIRELIFSLNSPNWMTGTGGHVTRHWHRVL